MFNILVVDDEIAIRGMIAEALTLFGWQVALAGDGVDALEKLAAAPFDMVLSDINMPRMGGFELLQRLEQEYPKVKRVLMTSYHLDDYMRMARDHNVGNVITKSVPLDFKELRDILSALLHNAIFGIDRYMLEPHSRREFILQSPGQIDEIADVIVSDQTAPLGTQKFRVVLFELMTNALFYGARSEQGDNKQEWVRDFRVPEEEAVIVTACFDREKAGVAVLDRGGKLDKNTVLYWLDRQTTHDERGLPYGVFDYHGRGFFITRRYVDRFLINIEKGKRCECCVFNYFESKLNSNKPLLINEI